MVILNQESEWDEIPCLDLWFILMANSSSESEEEGNFSISDEWSIDPDWAESLGVSTSFGVSICLCRSLSIRMVGIDRVTELSGGSWEKGISLENGFERISLGFFEKVKRHRYRELL
jgi:hypothetical protein